MKQIVPYYHSGWTAVRIGDGDPSALAGGLPVFTVTGIEIEVGRVRTFGGGWMAIRYGEPMPVHTHARRDVALAQAGWLETLPAGQLAERFPHGAQLVFGEGNIAFCQVDPAEQRPGAVTLLAGLDLDSQMAMATPAPVWWPWPNGEWPADDVWRMTVNDYQLVALTPPCDECDPEEAGAGVACPVFEGPH